MELKQLKTFTTVARLLSFHTAARELHFAQSTVSAQVRDLEAELGVRLFERLGRRILLTDAGERLLEYAQKMLDLDQEAQAELGRAAATEGSLTIRVPESFCAHRLPPVIARFRQALPRVRLSFTTCTHEGLEKDLRKGVTDLAFLLSNSMRAGDLEVEPLAKERLVLVAAPGHPLAAEDRLDLTCLAGETLLISTTDCSYLRIINGILAKQGITPGIVLTFNSIAAIKECVAAGLGLTVIPAVAVEQELRAGKLVALPNDPRASEVTSLMIWHRKKWLSPILVTFLNITRELLGGSGDRHHKRVCATSDSEGTVDSNGEIGDGDL